MPMAPVEWPLRAIAPRAPSFIGGLTVSVTAMVAAIVVRGVFLGWPQATALSATFFPAFVVATLYGGWRWGWATLAVGIGLGFTPANVFPQGMARESLLAMYGVSGAVTVAVAGGLRDALLRLEQARHDERKIRRALDESETRLKMAQDAGAVGLWDWDLATDKGVWSNTLYRNLGLPPTTDGSMRAFLEVVHPQDREAVRATNIAGIKQGRLEPVEFRVVWPDGQVRWMLTRGDMIRDPVTGQVVRAIGVTIDVSERRAAFEQMRQSEERFRVLADSAPVLMWVSRTDGAREFANKAYVDFLGAPYEEAIVFDWRQRLHPEDLPRILKEQVAGEASRQLFTLEARYRRVDGEWRWIRSVSQPRYDPTGAFAGFIGIGFDVTDAKQAEVDLKRINDLLADRVQAALAERDKAEADLRHAQRMEAVGQLTGGVAHDFNNLLTVVIGALDLIQRHPGDADRRERMIEAALGAARRGERLTQQLLAFSRRQALKPQPARIDAVLLEAEPLLRRAVGEAVSLTIAPSAGEAVAMIDVAQFEAAVMNLVVNARDAVTQGGAIRVETHACDLAEGEAPEAAAGPYVRLDVHDTGVGMDAATLERVFDPFFTTKEVGKGTGLGLSQVYGFARQSGGAVTIDSAPGKGASVRIYLPRSEAAAQPAKDEELSAGNGPALRVLLVEDDLPVGDMVAAMLEGLGHAVTRADGVEPALRALADPAPLDLMLTDLIMPGPRTGVDLAREAAELRPGLPVILSSGYTGEALSTADGAPWPLLRKPYSTEALARMIEAVLQKTPHAA